MKPKHPRVADRTPEYTRSLASIPPTRVCNSRRGRFAISLNSTDGVWFEGMASGPEHHIFHSDRQDDACIVAEIRVDRAVLLSSGREDMHECCISEGKDEYGVPSNLTIFWKAKHTSTQCGGM